MLFYRPENSIAADVIPFYKHGTFYLYYLRDFRDISGKGEGTPWYLLTTNNFLIFKEHGEVIPRGGIEDQDLYIFTGSVFEHESEYYIFYTGHNPHLIKQKSPCEAICMAKSKNLTDWEKVKDFMFFAPDGFEPDDWRDPYVFKNPENGKFGMLLAARKKNGGRNHRGCTVFAESEDLYNWQIVNPDFFNPNKFYTHECPDLFKMGEWWYLIYSEFSDKAVTRYAMSRSLNGSWISPKVDYFDNRVYYAAKSATDGTNRYLFGWNATRENNSCNGLWQWGGNIVVHQIVQQNDGLLSIKMPESLKEYFSTPYPTDDTVKLSAENTYLQHKLGIPQGEILLEAELLIDQCQGEFGVLAKGDDMFDECYIVKFSPMHNRISLDKFPRTRRNLPFMAETERYVEIMPNRWYRLKMIISADILELYFDDVVAFSGRLYSNNENQNLGLFAKDVNVSVKNIKLTTKM